jgi:hypothetical protein
MSRDRKKTARAAGRKVALHKASDMGRLVLHLLTHWALPRVLIDINSLPPLTVQRAQTRFLHIAEGSERQILGLLTAGATVLIGSVYLVWNWSRDWHSLVWLGIIALYAGVAGTIVSVSFSRLRLLLAISWFLFRTRRQRKAA